jgi:flagellar hook-associated protein 1 FlgK
VKTLAVLDTVFSDGQGTVGEALDAFDSAVSDFAANPNSTAVRQVVLARADDLAQSFHRASDALTGARVDANARLGGDVKEINDKLDEIGSLNGQIVTAKSVSNEAGDLEDRRDQLIREISDKIPVTTTPAKTEGAVNVMLAGSGGSRVLVGEDSTVHHLLANPDATTGDVRIFRQTAGAIEDITGLINTGSIGGTIAARDGALADARNALDQLASDVGTAYNTQHAVGIGLDGGTGRNLFTPPAAVSGAAANMGVSTDVAGQPNFLGAAQNATSLPGDNRNALLLLGVRDQRAALAGSATLQQGYSALVAAGGSASRTAQDASDHASANLSQIDALRESASGVSTDEEMIAMMKFQRAYQASLRVIETADSMMGDLLNMRFGG